MKIPRWTILGLACAAGLRGPASAGSAEPAAESPATAAKIAAMTPLFDGATLAGWIQSPPAPDSFAGTDFVDLAAFAAKLRQKSDPVSAYLGEQLDAPAQAALSADVAAAGQAKALTSLLVKNLNRLVGAASFAATDAFRSVQLRPETQALLGTRPSGEPALRLNRMLLEDAYPQILWRSPAASWTVKDGALASTGAGRGVIYTQADYAHYRLIFKLRHLSGKPDHQPCILIFGARPAPGERGLDALGAIQFQAPNGGHWDYRPGHNNGGTGFTNPVKTKFANQEWSQIEILVNAATGEARMAVAEPIRTRAVENLDFRDPAAGKTGPIAWQMHNAGLFDEFKDVRIEVDPQPDRLITTD